MDYLDNPARRRETQPSDRTSANSYGFGVAATLATLLKARRDLGCFPAPDAIHAGTVAHLAAQLGDGPPQAWPDEVRPTKSLYRYQAAVRTYLSVTAYDDAAEQMLTSTILDAAETMSDPADLINRAIEALQAAAIDLPAFSTLDRLVNRLRAEVHGRMYDRVAARLSPEHMAMLDALLAKPPGSATTGFNRLKQAPGPATPNTVRLWTDRLAWLDGLIDPDPPLEGIAHTKLRQFAAEAAAAEVSDLLDIAQPGKRHTLLLALLRQSRMRCRDELIEMMLRRIRRTQAAAKEQLDVLHDQHRGIEESLIGIFGQVLEAEQAQDTDAQFGRQVRKLLSEQGGAAALAEQCETVSAWHRGNDLPLLWPIHAKHRVLLFRLLDFMDVQSATQDRSLLDALAVVSSQRHARRDEVEGAIDLGFASQRWQAFVAKRRSKPGTLDRRALEVCVFVHLADALQTGDLFVVGAETFADYRAQLLPWAECEARLPAYCAALGIPRTGRGLRRRAEGRTDDARRRGRCRLPGQHRIQRRCRRHAAPEAVGIDGAAGRAGRVRGRNPCPHAGAPPARHPQAHRALVALHPPLRAAFRLRPQARPGHPALPVHRVRLRLQSRPGPDRPACARGRDGAGVAPDQRPACHRDKLEAAMVDVIDQYARFPLAPALGRRPRRHRRRHARQAAREQPARLPAHPLRRLWRHRLPPHRRQLHRPVHQLHPVRRVGGRPYPGRAAEEPVRHPARHAACRHARAKRAASSACAGCWASS